MKGGKHRPCPLESSEVLRVLAVLALLEWEREGS